MYKFNSQRGFTLIELLVVIAIIAILAAILFPVFARAREKARQTTCMSNQRQIAVSAQMYAQDHQETLPGSASFWTNISVDDGIKVCPSAGKTVLPGFIYNAVKCSNIAIGTIADTSATWLTMDGKNNDIDARHGGKVIKSFVDGHCSLGEPYKWTIVKPVFAYSDSGTPLLAINGEGLSLQLETGYQVPSQWPSHAAMTAKVWNCSLNKYILFNLGDTYNLSGICIWNYYENGTYPNRAVKGITLTSSIDATTNLNGTYTAVTGAPAEFRNETQSPWRPQFYPFTGGATKAKWVKMVVTSNFGDNTMRLAEVRFVQSEL
jgi:prepilin-type N-terminal cleavage/methylation domain-containing protein